MKKLLHTLAMIELILGVLGSLLGAYSYGKNMYGEQDWGLTIGFLAGSIFGVLIVYAILEGLSEIIKNQETILFNIKNEQYSGESYSSVNNNSSNLFSTSSNSGSSFANMDSGDASSKWICEICGRENSNSVTVCSCGRKRIKIK